MNSIRIGTRASTLALWQAEKVKELLSRYTSVEIKKYTSKGDEILNRALHKINDKGLFTKVLEDALINNEIDIAVHSLKDLPSELPSGLELSCYPVMEDPRDVLISEYKSIAELPHGARVATGSLRRKSQLLSLRPDIEVFDIRGNIETRLQKYKQKGYDGLILAYAGIKRLNITNVHYHIIPAHIMIPAVGQGILGIESRTDCSKKDILRKINVPEAEWKAKVSRSFLRKIEGGCSVPAGCIVEMHSSTSFSISAFIGSVDGKELIKEEMTGNIDEAQDLGREIAETILKKGGRQIRLQINPLQN